MFKLKLFKKALNTLDLLKKQNDSDLKIIMNNLDEIEKIWLKSQNIKNIWDDIYRKRVWRWRILFTVDEYFHIWIIALEKDTKKDYDKWKSYIISKM